MIQSSDVPAPVDFLGIPVCPLSIDDFVEWVVTRAKGASPHTAYAINAHSVNLAFQSRAYWNALQRCNLVYCDGISVLWGSRLLGRPLPEKVTTTDCLDPISKRCEQEGLSMYILGNAPGVAKQAAENLNRKYPELQIRGASSGYFQGGEEKEVVSEIRRLQPQVLWVGMGNPLQELWVEKHLDNLQVPVTLTCGGMMDIVSGNLTRPPHWITDNGFEWAYRLATKPKYNWRRYVIGNVAFLIKLARHRRYETTGAQ